MVFIKKALFSLYDTSRADYFARILIGCGWQIVASRKTGLFLSKKKIPFLKLADYLNFDKNYGFSPTLHPKIEYNLTDINPGSDKLDLVYIITYPLIYGNDVGGHTLLALAAKGQRIPVFTKKDMEKVLSQIKKNGDITSKFHEQLITKAYTKVSNHFLKLSNPCI